MAKALYFVFLAALAWQAHGIELDTIKNTITNLFSLTSLKCTKDGLYSHPQNCSSYIECADGKPTLVECPEKYHFNNKTKKCEERCRAHCDLTLACECKWKTCGKEVCYLPPKVGPCSANLERYHYEKRSGMCVKFIYGGCKGNENNFETKETCEEECWNAIDVCQLRKDAGPCNGYFRKYFYNSKTGKCEKFVYGGCQGNGNNFSTMEDCEKRCSKKEIEEESTINVCRLDPKKGPCDGHFKRYFFNYKSGHCETFVYGGCRGNANNFKTVRDCEIKCLRREGEVLEREDAVTLGEEDRLPSQEVCKLPPVKGPCKLYFPRFYYNHNSGRCETFIYGGCRGNGNNFRTQGDCLKTCDTPRSFKTEKLIEPTSDCESPAEIGACRGKLARWNFDSRAGRCVKFIYGGCGGNENNYETREECMKTCSKSSEEKLFCPAPDGNFPHPIDCSLFFECKNGDSTLRECPDEEWFDVYKRKCVSSESDVKCAFTCPEPNGKFVFSLDCSVFVNCTDNKPRREYCPHGKLFDILKMECLPAGEAECYFQDEEQIEEELRCPEPDGDFYWPPNCTKYLRCERGVGELISCPPKEAFNLLKRKCLPKNETSCRRVPELQCRAPNGDFPYVPECEKFIRCKDNVPELKKCPAGTAFHFMLRMCVAKIIAVCAKPEELQCVAPNGDFPYFLECKKFIRCRDDEPELKDCPPGEAFHFMLRRCVPEKRAVCLKAEELTCPNSNGDFPYLPACEKFIRCTNGVAELKECEEGKAFHAILHKCVPRYQAACAKTEELECPEPNGDFAYFPKCEKFIRCTDSVAELKDCPSGEAFHFMLRQCVPENEAACVKTEELECPEPNGDFPYFSKYEKFIRCKDSVAELKDCPIGQAFHITLRRCVPEREAACARVGGADCEVCTLQAKTGPCKALVLRWYYDVNAMSCKEFTYGGCKGNKNNFETETDCQKACH